MKCVFRWVHVLFAVLKFSLSQGATHMSISLDHGLCRCTREVYRMRTVEDET